MARALECPACGARHRVDTLPDSPTFRCDRCGQTLKVPDGVRGTGTAPHGASGAVRGGSAAASAPPPPPRRRGGTTPTGPTVSATSSTTAAMPAVAAAGAAPIDDAPRARTSRTDRAPREKVRLYWRVVAWVVAVPLGFVITAWPAFEFGLIEKDDVLDVFVGEGTGRYLRLLIGAAIWALVTALLVQLFVEGGRALAARRRAKRARDQDPGPPRGAGSTVDEAPPPPARPRRPTPVQSA
jgi:hypothetical protein